MRLLLLDTNVVSILFKPDHALHEKCLGLVSAAQLFISFMTRAELLLWPRQNRWGPRRTEEFVTHVELCTTLFPDEPTRGHWVAIVSEGRWAGRPMTTADAWIAATAIQWDLPLVTADYGDFEHINGLTLVPVT
jgi:predicted nucleic acid-binding protein